jgi:hypothetical protein
MGHVYTIQRPIIRRDVASRWRVAMIFQMLEKVVVASEETTAVRLVALEGC